MKKSEADIIRAAVTWWHSKRPMYWTASDHIANPTVDIGEVASAGLAVAVAAYVKSKLKRDFKKSKSK